MQRQKQIFLHSNSRLIILFLTSKIQFVLSVGNQGIQPYWLRKQLKNIKIVIISERESLLQLVPRRRGGGGRKVAERVDRCAKAAWKYLYTSTGGFALSQGLKKGAKTCESATSQEFLSGAATGGKSATLYQDLSLSPTLNLHLMYELWEGVYETKKKTHVRFIIIINIIFKYVIKNFFC